MIPILKSRFIIDWTLLLQGVGAMLALAYVILGSGQTFVILAAAVLWLTGVIWSGRSLSTTGLEVPLFFGLAALLLNMSLSSDPRRSLNGLTLMLFYFLWFYLIFDLVRRGWPADVAVWTLLIIGAFVIVIGFIDAFDWFVGWFRFVGMGGSLPDSIRVVSVFKHSNVLAIFLVLLIPLNLERLFSTRRLLPKLALMLWLLAALAAQFLTSSRGGWLASIVAVGVFFALGGRSIAEHSRQKVQSGWDCWKKHRVLMGFAFCLVILAVAVVSYLAWRQLQHDTHGSWLSSRHLLMQAAWSAFSASPFYGMGLSTFSTAWLKHNPVPMPFFPSHAHNTALTILAEQGIIGILALTSLAASTARLLWRKWQGVSPQHRLFMAGAIASMAGLVTHSMLDDFVAVPAISMTILTILAMSLALPSTRETEERSSKTVFLVPLCAVMVVVLIVVGSWSALAVIAFDDGVKLAQDGKWEEAIRSFDRAVSIDGGFAFYRLQRGYAWGVIAAESSNAEALKRAIADYEQGIQREPGYALNHVNLFALYWQAGRRDEALAELRTALSLAHYPIYDRGGDAYGRQVFHRQGIHSGLLPQLETLVSRENPISQEWLETFTASADAAGPVKMME